MQKYWNSREIKDRQKYWKKKEKKKQPKKINKYIK